MSKRRGAGSRWEWLWGAAGVLLLAWLLLAALWPRIAPAAAEAAQQPGTFACTVTRVHDGDGPLWCRELGSDGRPIKVRLSGIAARELDGTCAPGHPCPAATAQAAKAELTRLALGQVLSCRAEGRSYGRVAAFCRRPDGLDLSCAMVASGTAARWERYWRDHSC